MTALGGADHKAELAEDYLSAVAALMKSDAPVKPQSLAVMFLLAHALELLLKAYVELMAPEDKKMYRHDLGHLWERSVSLGLLVEDASAQAEVGVIVSNLKDGHEEYQFRYANKSFNYSGPIMTEQAIQKVHVAVLQKLNVHEDQRKAELERQGMVSIAVPVGIRISIERN